MRNPDLVDQLRVIPDSGALDGTSVGIVNDRLHNLFVIFGDFTAQRFINLVKGL